MSVSPTVLAKVTLSPILTKKSCMTLSGRDCATPPKHYQRAQSRLVMSTKRNYRIGDKVEDPDSKRRGVIVHIYRGETVKDIVAVLFDDTDKAIAVHREDVCLLKA